MRQRRPAEAACLEHFHAAIRARRPYAWQQLHHTEGSDSIAWIVGPSQYGDHIFDVRGFENTVEGPIVLPGGTIPGSSVRSKTSADAVVAGFTVYY